MSVEKVNFGTAKDGREVSAYILRNSRGMKVKISSMGAAVVSIEMRDFAGEKRDVVLGYDDASGYEENGNFFGAAVGRGANRTEGAQFTIDGTTYHLDQNEGGNNLHSGPDSYAFRLWECTEVTEDSVSLHLDSPDGDQGYPGNLSITVTYTLTDENELKMHYEGDCDQTTIVNMTNHTYFNLNGHNCGSVRRHWVRILASGFTPVKETGSIPTGEIWEVAGTPMDFTKGKVIGEELAADYHQMKLVGGYDHNYVIDGWDRTLRKIAEAEGEQSGITMKVYTDLPGVQFYTANSLEGTRGKKNMIYHDNAGFCLETQYFPNSANQEGFPAPILEKGERYDTTTIYQFGVR